MTNFYWEPPFDIILVGATGYVGALIVECWRRLGKE
jgi:short subunit dehydrogenase-like uncharacterized protein